MDILKILFVAGIALSSLATPAMAQSAATTPPAAIPQAPVTELSSAQRSTIATDLIAKWQPAANKRPGGGGTRWSTILRRVVASADATNVLHATSATSLDQLHDTLYGYIPDAPMQSSGAIGNGSAAPQVLGDTVRDTVYTPLPYGRCRVADSRVISSAIPAGATRNLYLEDSASYSAQGGNGTYANGTASTNCGMPLLATAYALSVTLLSPAASGVFKIMPYGSSPQIGNSILFNAGDYGANGDVIVKNCRGCGFELSISSSGAAIHYVIDVIGYFMPPQATPLQCMYTAAVTHYPAHNQAFNVQSPACAAGYTSVSTACQAGNNNMPFRSIVDGLCAGINLSGAASYVQSNRFCCRVPGR
jgi:hypothetical protein